MSYVLGTVATASFSDAEAGVTDSPTLDFTQAESVAAGIQPPDNKQMKAGFSPWWLLGGLAAAWYLHGVNKTLKRTGGSYRGQHADDGTF